MKPSEIQAHMDVALRYAEESQAVRSKVGAIVVKDGKVISIGWNGTPTGWHSNICEDRVDPTPDDYRRMSREEFEAAFPYVKERSYDAEEAEVRYALVTKPEVIHAERNAIAKLASSHESGKDAVMFITHQPCFECAKEIKQVGIKEVFYFHPYRIKDGVNFLRECGIPVRRVEKDILGQIERTRATLAALQQMHQQGGYHEECGCA